MNKNASYNPFLDDFPINKRFYCEFSWLFSAFERQTKYGCQGSTLKIECEEGELINLVRANFGRFSISICNEEGITDWSVNCMEPRTLRIINSR